MADSLTLLLPSRLDELEQAADRVRAYLRNTRAPATYRAYASDWRDFKGWCEHCLRSALPAQPDSVMLYLGHLGGAGKQMSTITRKLAAIAQVHRLAGFESPTEHRGVREVTAGMRRTHGVASHGKEALLTEDLRAIMRSFGSSLRDVRDRALLLIGFAGAFRRSELVALEVSDLRFVADGLVCEIQRSKSDQEGQGREIAIPVGSRTETCPVAALRTWLAQSEIQSGPLFRSISRHCHLGAKALTPTAVALVIKQRVVAAGLDPALYAGHSLRAGFATSAALGGAPEWAIMKQTGHRSRATLDRYVRPAGRFRNNPVSYTGI